MNHSLLVVISCAAWPFNSFRF